MRSASNSIILRQLLARHALEIAGVVGRGEGVLVAADPQHGLGEFTGGMLAGALEHQMFEEVREPDLPGVSSAEPTLYQIICVTTGVR